LIIERRNSFQCVGMKLGMDFMEEAHSRASRAQKNFHK
jgi:hypothetical protein